jgi:Lar family restriction alleviation protein
MDEMKPCPFCGSENVSLSTHAMNGTWVHCDKCGTYGRIKWNHDENAAKDAWNTRTIEAALAAEVVELRRKEAERVAWYQAVVSDPCEDGEDHCPCVPALRQEIEKLRRQLAEANEDVERLLCAIHGSYDLESALATHRARVEAGK